MANLITIVRQEIVRLRKTISEKNDRLRDLTNELERHEKIAAMLGSGSGPRKPARQRIPVKTGKKAKSRTNWNSLLETLPRSFTTAEIKQAAGEAAKQADIHQALLRWRKAGTVAIRGRGRYRKVDPKTSRSG